MFNELLFNYPYRGREKLFDRFGSTFNDPSQHFWPFVESGNKAIKCRSLKSICCWADHTDVAKIAILGPFYVSMRVRKF